MTIFSKQNVGSQYFRRLGLSFPHVAYSVRRVLVLPSRTPASLLFTPCAKASTLGYIWRIDLKGFVIERKCSVSKSMRPKWLEPVNKLFILCLCSLGITWFKKKERSQAICFWFGWPLGGFLTDKRVRMTPFSCYTYITCFMYGICFDTSSTHSWSQRSAVKNV